MVELWPFQVDAKEALRQNMRRGIRRQILCSPTGSGKTEIAMSIVQDAEAKGSRIMFVCDRQTLVDQTSDRFAANGIRHGVAMGKQTRNTSERIQVASAQTLEKRGFLSTGMPLFDGEYAEHDIDLIIIDECHEVRKKIVNQAIERDIRTIGLSATPLTEGLADIYEAVVNVTSTNDLLGSINPKTGKPYLSPLHIIAPDAEVDTQGLRESTAGEWVREDVSGRVREIVGDIVPEWEKQTTRWFGGPVKTIAFCASVADSEDTAQAFQESGYDFHVIHYRQTAEQKQEIIEAFRHGKHMGLISCVALTKGFDVPEVRCLIDAYPHRKSLSMVIQKLGRVMRAAEGKEFGLVIDHAGNWLGFYSSLKAFFAAGVQDLKNTKLKNVTRKPKEKTEGLKCHSCGYVMGERMDLCPACGAKRRRPQGNTVQRDGNMGYSETLDGKNGSFTGNWWEEICAVVTKRYPKDKEKARRVALAKYRDIFKKWPPRGTEFEFVNREPHGVVADTCYRYYQRWRIAQKKRAEKEIA